MLWQKCVCSVLCIISPAWLCNMKLMETRDALRGEQKLNLFFTLSVIMCEDYKLCSCLFTTHKNTLEHRLLTDVNEQLSFTSEDQRSQYINVQTCSYGHLCWIKHLKCMSTSMSTRILMKTKETLPCAWIWIHVLMIHWLEILHWGRD